MSRSSYQELADKIKAINLLIAEAATFANERGIGFSMGDLQEPEDFDSSTDYESSWESSQQC